MIKGLSENEAKEQNGGFLCMLVGTLDTSLLGYLLTDKGTIRAGKGTIIAGRTFRAASSFHKFLNTKVLLK